MLKKFLIKWRKKSWFSKLIDLFFIFLLITLLFPDGRMAVGGLVNRAKSMISQPALMEDRINTSESAFEWKLKDMTGSDHLFSETRGKVIFLNLWATWCPPCVGEMPGIQKLYDKYKDNSQVAFVLVSNEPIETINRFMDKKNYTFPVFSSQTQSPPVFHTKSIPTTYLLSKKGEIVMKEVGAMNWGGSKMEAIIDELIRE